MVSILRPKWLGLRHFFFILASLAVSTHVSICGWTFKKKT
jgi:hypothetical protein